MLSIVTVTLNAEAEILRTLASIATQTELPFQHIVADGGSTDRTLDLVRRANLPCTRIVEIEDDGPYDAMNKALPWASGDYVLFLNAGDTFAAADMVEGLRSAMDHCPAVIVGDHYYASAGMHIYKKCQSPAVTWQQLLSGRISLKWLEGMPGHQSTIYRRDMLDGGFDTSFQIAADHDLLFRLLGRGVDFHHMMRPISVYHGGGFSAKRFSRCQLEWYTLARNYTRHPAGVHKFYEPSLGYRLAEKRLWRAGTGLDQLEGPYPRQGINFSFRWMIARTAQLTIMGGPQDADTLQLTVCGFGGQRNVGIEVPALGLRHSAMVPGGLNPERVTLHLDSEPSLPFKVHLTIDNLAEESGGRRQLGVMLLDAALLNKAGEDQRELDELPKAIPIGKRRMLHRRRQS